MHLRIVEVRIAGKRAAGSSSKSCSKAWKESPSALNPFSHNWMRRWITALGRRACRVSLRALRHRIRRERLMISSGTSW